jgi:hypothetical protein
MPINGRRPAAEIVEVIQGELVREAASNQSDKYWGFVNQIYANELPSLLPEQYIKKEAFITLLSPYSTGTVTVGTGTPGIQGIATSWTSALNDFFINVHGFNRFQRVTFTADTLLSFQNGQSWVEASGVGITYELFQDKYALPADFNYMMADDPEDPCVVSRQVSGSQVFLSPQNNDEFDRNFSGIVDALWAYTVKWINTAPYMFVLSAPSVADILRYSYIPQLTTLTEYTTGTVTFATTTNVIASGALWLANVDTSANTYYIRNDADGMGSSSKWYKILSVSTDTVLTLSSNFGGTTGAGQTYTISQLSKWPARFDDAILYKAALIADPDNVQMKKWMGLYEAAVNLDRTVESKRVQIAPLKQFFGKRGKS